MLDLNEMLLPSPNAQEGQPRPCGGGSMAGHTFRFKLLEENADSTLRIREPRKLPPERILELLCGASASGCLLSTPHPLQIHTHAHAGTRSKKSSCIQAPNGMVFQHVWEHTAV